MRRSAAWRRRLAALGGLGVLGVLVLVGVVAVTAPGPWPVSGLPGVTQLIAFRGVLALTAAGGAGLVAAATLVARRRRTAVGRALAAVAAGLAVVAAVHVGVLAHRGALGITGADPEPLDGDVVVIALNTQGGVGAADLAALVVERGADLVALPETDEVTAAATVTLLAERGLEFRSWSIVGSGGLNPSTAVLVAETLGDYEPAGTGPASSVTVTGTGPAFTAVHTRAPVSPDPQWWLASTRWAVRACAANPGGIVAGDFNATLDHPAFADLGGCADAAAMSGAAAVGTWPSTLPRALGAPIDHVLVDPTVWQVVRASVLEPPPGTDHRAVEAVLDRR